jgi:hypothetical protein
MKSLSRFYFFIIVLASAGFLSSCEPDNTITDDTGDSRNEFVGVWRFTETGHLKSGQSQSYIVTISLDPDNSNQVILNNFGNPGDSNCNAFGLVTTNQIVVSSQSLNNGWIVEGSGKRTTSGHMDWSYSITAGGDIEYYNASAVKQ